MHTLVFFYASSDNLGSSHAHSVSSDSGVKTGTVIVSSCATCFQCSLSIIEVIFSPPNASYVFDHNITLEPRFGKFLFGNTAEDVEPKAYKIISSITTEHLSEFRSLYNIPQNYELILPRRRERANTPSGCFAVYEEYLKSISPLPLPLFITDILLFWNLTLAQVHPLFSRSLVGFMIVSRPLGTRLVPLSLDFIIRFELPKLTRSGLFVNIALFAAKPTSIKS